MPENAARTQNLAIVESLVARIRARDRRRAKRIAYPFAKFPLPSV